jgi:hypothetical protein
MPTQELKELMRPLAKAAVALPAAAIRFDPTVLLTLARFLPGLVTVPLSDTLKLMKPYSEVRA